MQIISNAWHLLGAAIIFFLGAIFAILAARKFSVSSRRSLFLYVWHTAFSMGYLAYSLTNVADSSVYYQNSLAYSQEFGVGTEFVTFLTSIFTRQLGLSYLGVFLVFNLIGFIGYLAFCGAILDCVREKTTGLKFLGSLIVLLPSISFWSSALGKDAIAFLAVGFLLWGAIDLRRRFGFVVMAVAVMLLVRPHMAALMAISGAASIVLDKSISRFKRFAVGMVAIVAAVLIVPYAIEYAGLGSAEGAEDIAEYVEVRQGFNQTGDAGIDISGMSPPMQLVTYLFRPLPFEARSLTAFAASVDNLVLLGLFAVGGPAMFRLRRVSKEGNRLMLWLYSLSAWGVLAITTANLGIAVRQKWMFVPILMYLLLSAIGKVNSLRMKETVAPYRR